MTDLPALRREGCLDCGATDNDMPLDATLPSKQWLLICPEGGILCASCIVKRAARLRHVICVEMKILFADDFEPTTNQGE